MQTWPRVQAFGDGKPLLFLHGWAANGDFFVHQKPLARKGFRLVLPDLPGHGPNAEPDRTLAIHDLSAALAADMAARAPDRPVLVGWSMGAAVALDYLARADALPVAGLVIIDMTPKVANSDDWRFGLANGQDEAAMIRAADEMEHDWPAFAPRIGRALFARTPSPAPKMVERVSRAFAANDPATMAALWRSLARADFRERVATLRLPMLAIMGRQSRIYGPALAEWYRGLGGDITVASIENAGHAPQIEQPDHVNALIGAFANRVFSGTT